MKSQDLPITKIFSRSGMNFQEKVAILGLLEPAIHGPHAGQKSRRKSYKAGKKIPKGKMAKLLQVNLITKGFQLVGKSVDLVYNGLGKLIVRSIKLKLQVFGITGAWENILFWIFD